METRYAWYMLQSPSRIYKPYFVDFYKPLRVAQLVIASAHAERHQSYETFLRNFLREEDDLLGGFDEDDLEEAVHTFV